MCSGLLRVTLLQKYSGRLQNGIAGGWDGADYLGLTSVATRWRTDTYGNLCHGNRYKLCCLCMREKVWIIGCEDLRQPFCLL